MVPGRLLGPNPTHQLNLHWYVFAICLIIRADHCLNIYLHVH